MRDLAGPLSARRVRRRRRRFRAHGRAGGRSRRGARPAPRSAARHPRHRVPAEGVGGAAAPSPPARRRPTPRSRARSASRKPCAPSPRLAARTRWRSPFPATAWCARTATSPAIAGASSASASSSIGRRRDEGARPAPLFDQASHPPPRGKGERAPSFGRSGRRGRMRALPDRRLDWPAIERDLDAYGCAIAPKLLSPETCSRDSRRSIPTTRASARAS